MGRGEDIYQKQNMNGNNKEPTVWKRQPQDKKLEKQEPQMNSVQEDKVAIIDHKLKEVKKAEETIEKQILKLGKNLGWPDEDQTDFTSIWHRGGTRNYFQIEEELQGYFAFYTSQQIQEHMNKYLKFLKMKEEKKELIALYKNLKEERKIEQLKIMSIERD